MPLPPTQLDRTLARVDYGRALKGELLMEHKSEIVVPYAQPLLDAVNLFESLKIGYALIGGIAAMYYGRSRFTEDVDFVATAGHVELLSANPEEMEQFHFDPSCAHKLYHQSGVQVDIWKDEYADQIICRAVDAQLAGRVVRLIEPHDLVAMKLRAQRLKDDYDISEMIIAGVVNETTLEAMVTAEELSRFKAIKNRV